MLYIGPSKQPVFSPTVVLCIYYTLNHIDCNALHINLNAADIDRNAVPIAVSKPLVTVNATVMYFSSGSVPQYGIDYIY